MTYKSSKNWKDLAEFHHGGPHLTRRDFLARGLATGLMSVAVPKILMGDLVKKAEAAMPANCPPPTLSPGAIAQIFSNGGPTMGARFMSEAQAAAMNANMAKNYGVSGQANLKKLGPNMVIDTTSPFGFTLMQGPPGYPGGATAWQTNVLSKISGGAHLGPFNQDDGAGENTGLLGGVGTFKVSKMAKDIRVGVNNTLASWATGVPATAVKGNLTSAALSSTFSLTPAATGLTNAGAMTAASDAINSLAQALSPVFNTTARKGSDQLMTSAGCGFYGNSALADPNYGATLFNPTNITQVSSKLTVAQLSASEQAQVAAFYQAATGVAGGIIIEFGGRDYHGQSVQNNIAPADVEEARTIVMFLAACDAAQAPGAMIYTSNGQAIASGVQSVTVNVGGTQATVNGPVAQGDAGGSYNAGLILFYDPKGAPPQARFTGTTDANGNAKTDGKVGSSKEAVAGLFLSALKWVNGGTIPPAALKAMQGAGVAGTPTNTVVI